jgi:hypothetical protein
MNRNCRDTVMTVREFFGFSTVATVTAALALAGATSAGAGDLKAGAARVSITPDAQDFPWKEGNEKPFVGVHDPLNARALVLDDGAHKVVLVSVEATLIPTPGEVVKAIAQATGVAETNVMVFAAHTHENPLVFFHTPEPDPTEAKWIARLSLGAVEAARQAMAAEQPAKVSLARGQAFVNVNNGEEKGLTNWFDPTGPSDKTVSLMRVVDPQGKPLAMLVNYASHGESMFRSVTKDGGYEVSGDLPGATARMLEASPKGAPVVLYSAAAEADQLPLFKSLQPDAELPGSDQGAGGWSMLDAMARRLAAAVIDTEAAMPAGASDVAVTAARSSVVCPGQRLQRDRQTGQISAEARPPVTIPVQVVRVGDIALAGIGGDLGTDIGRQIKSGSPLANTVVISQLAGAVGYVLADASYEHPGHGLMGSPLKAGCAGPALTGAVARLAR